MKNFGYNTIEKLHTLFVGEWEPLKRLVIPMHKLEYLGDGRFPACFHGSVALSNSVQDLAHEIAHAILFVLQGKPERLQSKHFGYVGHADHVTLQPLHNEAKVISISMTLMEMWGVKFDHRRRILKELDLLYTLDIADVLFKKFDDEYPKTNNKMSRRMIEEILTFKRERRQRRFIRYMSRYISNHKYSPEEISAVLPKFFAACKDALNSKGLPIGFDIKIV